MTMRSFLISLVLAMSAISAARAGCVLQNVAELPVTMSGLRPIITLKINGKDAKFIVDTGGFFSFVGPDGPAKFGLTRRGSPYDTTVEGLGGKEEISVARAKDFNLASMAFHQVDFLVNEKSFGDDVDGVLGENVLGAADIEFDLANGVVRLFVPKGCNDASLAYWVTDQPYSVVNLTRLAGSFSNAESFASINGHTITVLFDTGASISILSLEAAAQAGVKPGGEHVDASDYETGVASKSYVKMWVGPFDSFKLGDEEIRQTRLRFGDMKMGSDFDMLVGADFFLSHRVFMSNSQHKLYFTYNGGPVFNLDPKAAQAVAALPAPAPAPPKDAAYADQPNDAPAFARRAAAFASRADFDHAIADLTQAKALAPTDPQYAYQRGLIEQRAGKSDQALDDFDEALKRDPNAADARLARADLYLARKDKNLGFEDLAAIDHAVTPDASVRLDLAKRYGDGGDYARAIEQLDQWIAAHPQQSGIAEALNQRCWYRGLSGKALDEALADCEAALKLEPGAPDILGSRALVRLRRGEIDKSIADFQAALRLIPDDAWDLYSQGLAELKKGLNSQGNADIAAAAALEPDIADKAKAVGLIP